MTDSPETDAEIIQLRTVPRARGTLRVGWRCGGDCQEHVPDIAHQCWHPADHRGQCTCNPTGRGPGPAIPTPRLTGRDHAQHFIAAASE